MSWEEVHIRDLGKSARFSGSSMEVLFQAGESPDFRHKAEGKVSAAEMPDGKLVIGVTTIVSDITMHMNLMDLAEFYASNWRGGAFFKVDWPTKAVEVYGQSKTIGALPEDVLPVVRGELQKLLDQFLLTQQG